MPTRSVLAKDWALEVNTSLTATPAWTRVNGLTQISPSWDTNMEDDADFDSSGFGSSVVTQRTWSIACEGRRKRVVTTGTTFTPDPGQEFLRTAGEIVGYAANIQCRWYRTDGGPEAYTGYASVEYSGGGGGVKDLEPFNVTLHGQGARTAVSNPSTAVPAITTLTPATGPAAGGTTITITGTAFTGATAVSFGGTPATTFSVVSDTSITATSPARAAGAQPVTVTTANGASNAVTYTYS